MPRRSSRAVPAPAAAPAPTQKRRASDRISAGSKADPKRQRYNSKNAKNVVRSTARKSKYFEDEGHEESESGHASEVEEDSGSAYEDTMLSSPSTEPDSEEPEALSTDEERTKRSTTKKAKPSGGRKTPVKPGAKRNKNDEEDHPNDEIAASLKDKELWREGVSTGLGPGKEVFIKKPKARDPGDIPYQDHTLHPNTMLFLQDLAKHNDRQWLKAHDADYRASKKDWETFVESLSEKISELDSTIPELPAKDIVFRIHRDIRFSKDPTPYKTHFSAAWSRTGRKGPYAAYYVHLQPGSCFVGSGLWQPEADKLALLREDIDHNSHRLKAVLRRPDMRREFFKGIPDDEKKAIQAFVSQNKESALKTKPKGYEADNENIELLRLRSFTIGKPLSDSEFMASNVQERIAAIIGVMEPFVTYLNSVVMPDPVDQDTGSESESA
ncbi:hypothetical protein IFM61606_05341 [Aspergillus udagawae]|uniref:Uncharacterized protein n=1 Tax=Aspergillus udagawae TaxID=91492 RepID=A0ABQ1AWD0_9EURO|nr:hypothetical protein IFM51744_08839 [Aspergillus udagawae]GFF89267.1 hypothetical protein IFM53868_05778 [Aspergillus udagawae]GFG15335.1 hypothetical protein IFM5058_07401 [Aspergillus udagawae]GFG25400.1 hypothetical protein IFM61606_05341 [Aspergillus udagawae]